MSFLQGWGPIADLSFRQLTLRTFALFLLFSCRRISDLLLLDVGDDFCLISESSAVFQLRFGLKQDRPGHASPPIRFSLAPDEALFAMHCVIAQHLLIFAQSQRSSLPLFLLIKQPLG